MSRQKVRSLLPDTEVEWTVEDGKAIVRPAAAAALSSRGARLVAHMRGRGTVRLSTDEIMRITRGED